jgi:ribonuclease Z
VQIDLISIEPGVLLEDEHFQLSAFPVEHRGPGTFGFAFEQSPHRPFLPQRATELGVPAGPIRRELVRGQSVTLPDGTVIEPEQVLGESRRGARLVHVGDCGSTEGLLEQSAGADGLVIEATYLESEAELAGKFGHLTARQAAELAKQAEVGHLYLTHISRRYREQDVRREAQAIFPNVSVARDFDRFQIRRDSGSG